MSLQLQGENHGSYPVVPIRCSCAGSVVLRFHYRGSPAYQGAPPTDVGWSGWGGFVRQYYSTLTRVRPRQVFINCLALYILFGYR